MVKVRVSTKGQIAVPKALRDQLGLREGTEVSLAVEGEALVLRKLPRSDWRRWQGRFRGGGMLRELEQEHRQEVERDRLRP